MNRQEIITLAESLGLLYPEPKSSSDYNSPAHMRLISKLEKFAEGCYGQGYDDGYSEGFDDGGIKVIERERG